jgi:hypothetical protein
MSQAFTPARRAIRLRFRYDGGDVELVSSRVIDKRVPPSEPLREEESKEQPRSGFWYEVQTGEGKPVYRRVVDNPIQMVASVYTGDPERPFTMVPIARPRGEFTLLVPELPGGEDLVMFSSPLELEAEAQVRPASELARFPLKARPGRQER